MLVVVVIAVIFIPEVPAKSRGKGKSHITKTIEKSVHKHRISRNGGTKNNTTKRQFINRPRIRYFGNRPYIWMKPSPLTQRTIVTTHIPRPPLALPYSARIMRLLASRYPSLYNRQTLPQGYAGYGGGLPQNSLLGAGLGTAVPRGFEDEEVDDGR